VGLVLCAAPASSADPVPRIEMIPSATKVGKAGVFHLSVKVVTEDTPVDSVTLPDLSAFEVLSRSVSNPVEVSFGFGSGGSGMQTTHTRKYDIWLRSLSPGKVILDPVVVTWKGKKYKGRPVTITVTNQPPKQTAIPKSPSPFPDMDWPFKMPGPAQPAPPPQPPASPPDAGASDVPYDGEIPEVELEGAEFDPKMFVQTVVEPEEVVIGQQVTLTLNLWSASDVVGNIEIPTEPGTDKFWVKDLMPPSSKVHFTPKIANDRTFQVAVLRKMALFPTQAGTLTIEPAVVKTSTPFGGVFGGGSYTRAGVPVTVEVSPLPAEGKPEGFVPSSVGNYTLSADLEPTETVVDQPVTFTLTLEGTGNIEMIAAPKLQFPEGVKTYEPQVTDLVSLKEGRVGGTKRIEYLIIPQKPGKVSIGPIEWPFYDPGAGGYRTLSAATEVLTVVESGADQGPSSTTEAGALEQEPEQRLRPIRTVAALEDPRAQIVRTPWFLFAVVLPPGLLAIVYLVTLGRTLVRGARGRNPAGRAYKEAMAVVKRAGESDDPAGFYAEIQRAIYLYLERRFGVPATGMTGPELMNALVVAGVDTDVAETVVKETENCEFARYGRSSSERELDMTGVRSRVQQVLQALERYDVPRRPGGGAP
jgi:hypothetical protein